MKKARAVAAQTSLENMYDLLEMFLSCYLAMSK